MAKEDSTGLHFKMEDLKTDGHKMEFSNEFNDDYFKIDPECHLVGDMSQFNYFPGIKQWWRSVQNAGKPMITGMPPKMFEGMEEWELIKRNEIDYPDNIIQSIDKYGVDIVCLLPESMMDTTDHSARWVSNGAMAKFVESNPDRFIYQPNISPIKKRGVKAAIKELEYWVKEKGAKIFKYYPCEDTYINDPDIYPFYEKAQELGIVLDIHTGVAWCAPNRSKYSRPILLDDVAMDFPDLTINAFHMGLPWFDELNWVAMKCPNVYLSLTSLSYWGITQPYKFAQIIGEAMRFVGSERITWGTDYVGVGAQYKFSVVGFRDFQIPEEMQQKYGYAPLTVQDKRNIFGENLGRLLGVDTTKRRITV